LQGMHRIRSAWQSSCTARINTLRGLCREFGLNAPLGLQRGLSALCRLLNAEECSVPSFCRALLLELVDEIHSLKHRLAELEAQLDEMAKHSEVCRRLRTIPGVGLIASTAFAGGVGDIATFRSGRRFASWLGLTPKEHSSGSKRHLGSINKLGDSYLRMLLVHGGRAVLWSADMTQRAGRPLDALRSWALRVRARAGHNKAAVAVANKLARLIWATWRRQQDFEFRSSPALAA